MKQQKRLFITMILVALLITACSGETSIQPSKSEVERNEDVLLILDIEDFTSEVGDLYVQKGNAEKVKIATDIEDGDYAYLDIIDAVLYVDEEQALYIKRDSQEPELIDSDDVYYFEFLGDQSGVLYLKGDDQDLYIKKWDEERQKVASETNGFNFNEDGSVILYKNDELSLYLKVNDTEKEKIASNIVGNRISPDGSAICYFNYDDDMYYRKIDAVDHTKIATGNIVDVIFSEDGDMLAYLNDYDYEKGELYLYNGTENVKVASDVVYYQVDREFSKIYYLNMEGNLNSYNVKSKEKEKISSDVADFTGMNDKVVLYTDLDENIYFSEIGKDREKIGVDIVYWESYDDFIVYQDEEDNLYLKKYGQEKELVSPDVEHFTMSYYGNEIAFVTKDDILKMRAIEGETITVVDDASKYYKVQLGNYFLYNKVLKVSDIAGKWIYIGEGNEYMVDISIEGLLKVYFLGDFQGETEFTFEGYSPNEGQMTTLISEEYDVLFDEERYDSIELINNDEMLMSNDHMKRIDKDDFINALQGQKDRIAQEAKAAEEAAIAASMKQEAESLAYDYLYTYRVVSKADSDFYYYAGFSSDLIGNLTYGSEFYIMDTYVDEENFVWCLIGAYNGNNDYIEGWTLADTFF